MSQHKQYKCSNCDYIYDESIGNEHEGYPAGTPFEQLPDDFSCPSCFVSDKPDFEVLTS